MASRELFTPDMQKLFLEIMITDSDAFARVQNIFDPENFHKSVRSVATYLKTFSAKYNSVPKVSQIKGETGVELELVPEVDETMVRWFMDEFEKFTRHQALLRAIATGADLIDKGEYGPVEKLIKDAVQISLTRDMGTDYFANPRERLMKLKSSNGQISTGWKALDAPLYGGFNRGELEIFAGGSGCVTADTKVHIMANGSSPVDVPIASLMGTTEADHIFVNSPDGWVRVIDCVEKTKDELYEFVFNSGTRIVASHDHLYQKPDLTWHYARDLNVGDSLLAEHDTDSIVRIHKINQPTLVYDLSVDHENHRYYTAGICSHNTGKSLFMQNLCINWMIAGMNGVYITLELSEELCTMRMDSMVTGMTTKEVMKDIDGVELKVKVLAKNAGFLRVKYMPAQSTANDIKAYLRELQIQTGKRLDFICVDYLDLLMPVSAKVSPSDLFVKDKYVSEELRNLAKEFNIVCVSASQLNRSSVEEADFNHSHISGGVSKINTADNVFGIFISRSMREAGRYQLQCMKTRNSGGFGSKIDLAFDKDSLRIMDVDDNEAYTTLSNSAPSSILNSLKPKSTVNPANGSSILSGSKKAEVNSSKLKEMLANIKR